MRNLERKSRELRNQPPVFTVMMKKGQEFEGKVLRMDFPNKGIVQVGEETVIVKNALPGQRIRGIVNKKRGGTAEGRLLQVTEPAAWEKQEGVCRHFGLCGGCLSQSLPYDMQLEIKEGQVRRLIDQVAKGAYCFEGILPSPVIQGYRNKMEYTFGDTCKDGPMSLGLHKRNSFYDILTVEDCRITDRDFTQILQGTLNFFQGGPIPYFHRGTHQGVLRHLLVRKAAKTGQILVDLVTSTQCSNALEQELPAWKQMLLELPLAGKITGILHTVNDSVADVIRDEGTTLLYGRDYIEEELLSLRFRITPFSFFQTNSLGAEVLYGKAREYVGETKDAVIYDLYSGTGTIAQILAPVAKEVTGVEIVGEAVQAAKANAAYNGLTNCHFLEGDVLKVLDQLTDQPDIVVVDPPRDGIHPRALEKLIAFGCPRIVYISCKPTSLARDLVTLQERGYVLERAACVDMFPATANVETVVLLSKLHTRESQRLPDEEKPEEKRQNISE